MRSSVSHLFMRSPCTLLLAFLAISVFCLDEPASPEELQNLLSDAAAANENLLASLKNSSARNGADATNPTSITGDEISDPEMCICRGFFETSEQWERRLVSAKGERCSACSGTDFRKEGVCNGKPNKWNTTQPQKTWEGVDHNARVCVTSGCFNKASGSCACNDGVYNLDTSMQESGKNFLYFLMSLFREISLILKPVVVTAECTTATVKVDGLRRNDDFQFRPFPECPLVKEQMSSQQRREECKKCGMATFDEIWSKYTSNQTGFDDIPKPSVCTGTTEASKHLLSKFSEGDLVGPWVPGLRAARMFVKSLHDKAPHDKQVYVKAAGAVLFGRRDLSMSNAERSKLIKATMSKVVYRVYKSECSERKMNRDNSDLRLGEAGFESGQAGGVGCTILKKVPSIGGLPSVVEALEYCKVNSCSDGGNPFKALKELMPSRVAMAVCMLLENKKLFSNKVVSAKLGIAKTMLNFAFGLLIGTDKNLLTLSRCLLLVCEVGYYYPSLFVSGLVNRGRQP